MLIAGLFHLGSERLPNRHRHRAAARSRFLGDMVGYRRIYKMRPGAFLPLHVTGLRALQMRWKC